MGPELSTIKMREKMGDEGMQQLVSVDATSSEPTKEDLMTVSDQRGPFEYHLKLWDEVRQALMGIHSFTVRFGPLGFLLSRERTRLRIDLFCSFASAYGGPK